MKKEAYEMFGTLELISIIIIIIIIGSLLSPLCS